MPVLDPQALIDNRVEAIRDFHAEVGMDKAELDLSGGVDSAVMAGLLIRALGADNVTLVYSSINSDPASLERAREVANAFGGRLVELNLNAIYDALVQEMGRGLVEAGHYFRDVRERCDEDPAVLGSIRSCIRAPVGRGINRMTGGGIRHGTGNECEDRWLRFYQKGGDGEVDTNPLAMLSKGEVYQLAVALGVPKSVLTARPTPDLWSSGEVHNDEDEISEYMNLRPREEFGLSWYSYVDPDSGEYTNVGLIERVSRFLDCRTEWHVGGVGGQKIDAINEGMLFADDLSGADRGLEPSLAGIVKVAQRHPAFQCFSVEDHEESPSFLEALLTTVRIVEQTTRHKWNPNIPTLGDREDLVSAGILTNTLPAN